MAKAKKSSLDIDEPVVVEGDEMMKETVSEPVKEKETEKAEVKSAATENKKQNKADTQDKKVEKKTNRGVIICAM